MVLRSVYFMVKFWIFIPELWDFIHQIVHDFKVIFRMSRRKLRTPWPIHFKLRIVIGIDSFMVCILFWWNFNFFHSKVMGLYSSNCGRFFVCRAVNWEPLGQFTSNFAQLLELIVLRSVYFLVKLRFVHSRVMGKNVFTNIVWMLTTGVSCALGAAVYLLTDDNIIFRLLVICTVGVQCNWILFNSVCEFHA